VTAARLLLLSGGLDSAALAAWHRPEFGLFIDYGQRPRKAEARAAGAVAEELGIRLATVKLGLSELGGGLLHGDSAAADAWPSPEWWPYRNQFLVSAAAAWAIKHIPGAVDGSTSVDIETGTVASDGARHADGTSGFYDALDALLRLQEGSVGVSAPAIGMSSADLLIESQAEKSVLGWTHSCHRGDIPCGECPGCYKREQLLDATGRVW
jgi:7-cyano-7-deazaguanine synthase